jgi:hypothetical protein
MWGIGFHKIKMAGHSVSSIRPGVEVGLITDPVLGQPTGFRHGQPLAPGRFVIQQEYQSQTAAGQALQCREWISFSLELADEPARR